MAETVDFSPSTPVPFRRCYPPHSRRRGRLWPEVSREPVAADLAAVIEYRRAVGALNERQRLQRYLEQVRGLLGHARIETTQLYAQIRPAALKRAVEFYEVKALDVLSSWRGQKTRFVFESGRRRDSNTQPLNINENNLVAPTGTTRPDWTASLDGVFRGAV